MKEGRCFNDKRKPHIILNCLEITKVDAICDISDVDDIENVVQKKVALSKEQKKRRDYCCIFHLKQSFLKEFIHNLVNTLK